MQFFSLGIKTASFWVIISPSIAVTLYHWFVQFARFMRVIRWCWGDMGCPQNVKLPSLRTYASLAILHTCNFQSYSTMFHSSLSSIKFQGKWLIAGIMHPLKSITTHLKTPGFHQSPCDIYWIWLNICANISLIIFPINSKLNYLIFCWSKLSFKHLLELNTVYTMFALANCEEAMLVWNNPRK